MFDFDHLLTSHAFTCEASQTTCASIDLTIVGMKTYATLLRLTNMKDTAFQWVTVALSKSCSYVGQPGTSKWQQQIMIVFVKAQTKCFVDKQQALHTRNLISTLRLLPLCLDNVLN